MADAQRDRTIEVEDADIEIRGRPIEGGSGVAGTCHPSDLRGVFLVIGDTHFKVNNVRRAKIMMKRVLHIARLIRPRFIVELGDTQDRHEHLHVVPFMLAEEFQRALVEIAPVYLLVGNHDRPTNKVFLTNEHPFNSFKIWPGMTVVDTTLYTEIDGIPMCFVPYVPTGRFNEALCHGISPRGISPRGEIPPDPLRIGTERGISPRGGIGSDPQKRVSELLGSFDPSAKIWFGKPRPKVIFSHQEFRGLRSGPMTSATGDVWPLDGPLVINGHFHEKQIHGPLQQAGAPMEHAFGDINMGTVSVYDLEEIAGMESPHAIPLPYYIPVRAPRLILNRWNACDIRPELKNWALDDDVKIVVSGTDLENEIAHSHWTLKTWLDEKPNLKISWVSTSTVATEESQDFRRGFLSELYDYVRSDPDLERIYVETFGRPDGKSIGLDGPVFRMRSKGP